LGFLLAHVLGVVLERVALRLGGLVVGFDAVAGRLVFVAGHRVGLRGHEQARCEGHHQQLLLHDLFLGMLCEDEGRGCTNVPVRGCGAQYFSIRRAACVRPSAFSHCCTCFSASSQLSPWPSWMRPSSWSRLPAITSMSSAVSLPYCSLTLPLSCFHL